MDIIWTWIHSDAFSNFSHTTIHTHTHIHTYLKLLHTHTYTHTLVHVLRSESSVDIRQGNRPKFTGCFTCTMSSSANLKFAIFVVTIIALVAGIALIVLVAKKVGFHPLEGLVATRPSSGWRDTLPRLGIVRPFTVYHLAYSFLWIV